VLKTLLLLIFQVWQRRCGLLSAQHERDVFGRFDSGGIDVCFTVCDFIQRLPYKVCFSIGDEQQGRIYRRPESYMGANHLYSLVSVKL